MSMDKCASCGRFVDTDSDGDCYLVTAKTVDLPKLKREHECVCEICREEMTEEELELRAA